MERPTAEELQHFVAVFRKIDRDLAVQRYIRGGREREPDPIAAKVLAWLAALADEPVQ